MKSTRIFLLAAVVLLPADPAAADPVAAGFAATHEIVARYCLDCHSGDAAEGEVDLAALGDLAAFRAHPKLVRRVEEMVSSGQMPPPESGQPTDAERQAVDTWLKAFLAAEARAHAGDPGRVVLRRLNNAEYTHTIRDLTGVVSLDPAREFPADGGAGEGFTNTGQSLVMSPGLATKYLDAAKAIATHAVLLPDGVAFSAGDSRRDFADEWLARLKAFYSRFTQPLSAEARATQTTVQHGITLDIGTEGFLPVEAYVAATLDLREKPTVDAATIQAVARERGLSPRYLATLWETLSAADSDASLLDHVRRQWRTAKPGDASTLAAEIGRWQNAVWKFNAAGQIGRHLGKPDGPASWQEAKSPLVQQQAFRVKIPPAATGDSSPTVTLHLAVGDAGDGNADDVVVFKAPRLVAAGRADLPLAATRAYAVALERSRKLVPETAAACLAGVAETLASSTEPRDAEFVQRVAAGRGVDPRLLAGWFELLGLGSRAASIGTLLTEKSVRAGGWDFVGGWQGPQALGVFANSSDQEVQIPQTMRPRGIVVHPAPEQRVVVGWRSPITGRVRVEGGVQLAHSVCGNGVSWDVQVRRGSSRQSLARAVNDNPARKPIGPLDSIAVREGDMLCLAVGSRDGSHACDSTAIDLTITASAGDGGAAQAWDLGRDCSGDLLAANPHPDSHGRADVWHFGSEPDLRDAEWLIPGGSSLARWMAAPDDAARGAIAAEIATLLASPRDPADASPDATLARMLSAPTGPLLAGLLADVVRTGEMTAEAERATVGLDPTLFGRHPDGPTAGGVGADDLCCRPPAAFTFEIPRALADGCELVTTAVIAKDAGPQASIQPWVGIGPAPTTSFSADAVIVANQSSPVWERLSRGLAGFRDLFPRAMCYGRIVPVDEVVTLNLFYREDDHLRGLMLDEAEAAELDRLWDELLFVAQEPLQLQDSLEQLVGYDSQIKTDIANPFQAMLPVIAARAEAFCKRLVEAEPRHVDAVVAFAGRAFRRPLTAEEDRRLRTLYATLRSKDLPHEEAIRMLLAHVLVAPEFLYKLETAGPGTAPQPVGDHELAVRLSYFLWSSLPDAELSGIADAGRLHDDAVLVSQMRRMLAAPAARRLAEEFGTQWLHVHGFAALDEKNAELFPTFAGLRADMEEETILFLDDFFRNDRSILALVDADHTFLNESLAKHYCVEGVTGPEWRRVEGMRKHGRGGILGLATTLSTQAGASRTSPILRGNWLYETILGEKLPKPPKDVPQLSENVPAGLSERQLIAMHSENAACAKCHRRIDPFGFALEEFDAIGRLRTTDAAGRPIDATATALDGTAIEGQQGLRAYLLGPRRDQFVRVFCKKLLGYALGRGVQLSDEPLLDDMVARLAANDYRVSVAIEAIVTSPQFRSIRGRDAADDDA